MTRKGSEVRVLYGPHSTAHTSRVCCRYSNRGAAHFEALARRLSLGSLLSGQQTLTRGRPQCRLGVDCRGRRRCSCPTRQRGVALITARVTARSSTGSSELPVEPRRRVGAVGAVGARAQG